MKTTIFYYRICHMSTITVTCRGAKTEFSFLPGSTLLQVLRAGGFPLSAPCGGKGVCGKCLVQLEQGCRRQTVSACKTVLTEDCSVLLPSGDDSITWNAPSSAAFASDSGSAAPSVGACATASTASPAASAASCPVWAGQPLGAAVDLGSTTVALSLLSLSTGSRLSSVSRWNAQQSYGADVISRISYCMEASDGLSRLSALIRDQLYAMLQEACSACGAPVSAIKEMFLAGNTVMQHLFAGLSPVSIASAPFTPLSLFRGAAPCDLHGIPVHLAPCVAGYVGGDITSGILASGICRRDQTVLFIDIGTNGEMALWHAGRLTACAVASGPAFEGANISCGMPAAKGAVSSVTLESGQLSYSVIGGGEALGLCGSGLLDLVSCLLSLGVIDESGCLDSVEDDPLYQLSPRVTLTQKDIRQLQLAKAAVAAGIRTLLEEAQLNASALNSVVLAGGFGNRLRPESAIRIGMLPQEFAGKVLPAGNTSLAGAELALLRPSARDELAQLSASCVYKELSTDAAFTSRFVDEMTFPEMM